MGKDTPVKVALRYEGAEPERPVNLGVGVPMYVYRNGEVYVKIWQGLDHLNVEIPAEVEPDPQWPRATSAITMIYGCGHQLFRTNGDIMRPACP